MKSGSSKPQSLSLYDNSYSFFFSHSSLELLHRHSLQVLNNWNNAGMLWAHQWGKAAKSACSHQFVIDTIQNSSANDSLDAVDQAAWFTEVLLHCCSTVWLLWSFSPPRAGLQLGVFSGQSSFWEFSSYCIQIGCQYCFGGFSISRDKWNRAFDYLSTAEVCYHRVCVSFTKDEKMKRSLHLSPNTGFV